MSEVACGWCDLLSRSDTSDVGGWGALAATPLGSAMECCCPLLPFGFTDLAQRPVWLCGSVGSGGQRPSCQWLGMTKDLSPWAFITRNYTLRGLSIVLEAEKPGVKEPTGSGACYRPRPLPPIHRQLSHCVFTWREDSRGFQEPPLPFKDMF